MYLGLHYWLYLYFAFFTMAAFKRHYALRLAIAPEFFYCSYMCLFLLRPIGTHSCRWCDSSTSAHRQHRRENEKIFEHAQNHETSLVRTGAKEAFRYDRNPDTGFNWMIKLRTIRSWLPPFCKQNLLLFTQPRWQLRRTYFFNHYNLLF